MRLSWPMRRALLALVTVALMLSACSSGDDDEATTEELLEELEGRPLTPAEVAEREEVAALICTLDDNVLVAMWEQLDTEQLQFQDIIFGRTCPERLPLYAESTGRFATDDGD